ncbi:uncharacterized protein LOC110923507 isoform X2 [Helianthus annuus]|uniref:uncharacterized protein LOC110923507 isoform X2 n=1 Tax=Helianthus annuus TaxID=4232 RepID=UPI000B8F3A7F|nr:uncharacterized protein LOC110923507 isoform X2 [Helianthus annuus]XP_022023280.1 uncharacterized protein LOC110923507 isoform X2 [Helianthus annuus]
MSDLEFHRQKNRETSLRQIWRAATLGEEIDSKDLSKINIEHICAHIRNLPSTVNLRNVGILFHGVAIAYQGKLKTRLLELNILEEEASNLEDEVPLKKASNNKSRPDPKGKKQAPLKKASNNKSRPDPKGKSHAQFEDVDMALDNLDSSALDRPDLSGIDDNAHQAAEEDITLGDHLNLHQTRASRYQPPDRIEGDIEMHDNEDPQVDAGRHNEMPAIQDDDVGFNMTKIHGSRADMNKTVPKP